MAEDAVEDDADAHVLRRLDEMLEVVIRAENRVDFEIVARIVMMIALRLEDRVQIDCVDAEILEIRQLRLDAAQIAAEEIIGDDFLRVRVFVVAGVILPRRMEHGAALRGELVAHTAEAVGENLVHDGMLRPVRRLRASVIDRNLIRRRRLVVELADTAELLGVVAVELRARHRRDDEVIPDEAARLRQLDFPLVELFFGLHIVRRRERIEFFALPLAPDTQQHLADVFLRLQRDAELERAARFRCADGGTIVDVL